MRSAADLVLRSQVGRSLAPKVKRLRDRLDDREVSQARNLLRALRSDHPPDVVAFGDSNWLFRADDDRDQRNLTAMFADELGPDVSLRVLAGAGYNAGLMAAFCHVIEISPHRPVVVAPLCARLVASAFSIHPRYHYRRAISVIEGVTADTPLLRLRARDPGPTPEEFAEYGRAPITTWAGTTTMQELRSRILDPEAHGVDDRERLRLLFAYHHGERVAPDDPPVRQVEGLGRALRRLGSEVVVFETTCPVEQGEALWGPQFRERCAETLGLMRTALRAGYGELEILETGLSAPASEFIDPDDGSEHLNEHGRIRIARELAEATRGALARQRG